MKFIPLNFRHFHSGADTSLVLSADTCPLIHIAQDGNIVFANKEEQKRILIANFWASRFIDDDNGGKLAFKDVLLWSWSGQKRTDVFEIREEDVTLILGECPQ